MATRGNKGSTNQRAIAEKCIGPSNLANAAEHYAAAGAVVHTK